MDNQLNRIRLMHSLWALWVVLPCYANAMDIKIDLYNRTKQTITLKIAIIPKNETDPGDDELFKNPAYGKFEDLIINATGDGTSYKETIKKLPKEGTLLIVGIYALGGRTEVIRKNLLHLQHDQVIPVVYDYIKGITPSLDFSNYKNQLPKNLFAEYTDLLREETLGSFLLVVEGKSGITSVLPLIPAQETTLRKFAKNYTSAEDIFSAQILAKLDLDLPVLPMAFHAAFAQSQFVQIKTEIFNSGLVNIHPKTGGYYDLFLSVPPNDLEVAIDKYEEFPNNCKLLFITSAIIVDSICYNTNKLSKLDLSAKIGKSTIITAEGNYSVENVSRMINYQTNQISQINIRNFVDYLKKESVSRAKRKAQEAIQAKDNDAIRLVYNKLLALYPSKIQSRLTNVNEICAEISKIEIKPEETSNQALPVTTLNAIQQNISENKP